MCSLGQHLRIVCPVSHKNNPAPSPRSLKNVRDYPHLDLNREKKKRRKAMYGLGNDRNKIKPA